MGREWITKQLTAREATESVDALSKALYERLFDYLVSSINEGLSASAPAPAASSSSAPASAGHHPSAALEGLPFFGVLDIFGFESFETNSLEQVRLRLRVRARVRVRHPDPNPNPNPNRNPKPHQLAINFANEKLQQHFNATIFTAALDDYRSEGIPVEHIAFPDNQLILHTIEGRPHGVLTLLKEECSLGSGTDESYPGPSPNSEPSPIPNPNPNPNPNPSPSPN